MQYYISGIIGNIITTVKTGFPCLTATRILETEAKLGHRFFIIGECLPLFTNCNRWEEAGGNFPSFSFFGKGLERYPPRFTFLAYLKLRAVDMKLD